MSAWFFALVHAGTWCMQDRLDQQSIQLHIYEMAEAVLVLLAAETKINLWRQQLRLCIYIGITTFCIGVYSLHVLCDCFSTILFGGRLRRLIGLCTMMFPL
jgi:hypothetical protein